MLVSYTDSHHGGSWSVWQFLIDMHNLILHNKEIF